MVIATFKSVRAISRFQRHACIRGVIEKYERFVWVALTFKSG